MDISSERGLSDFQIGHESLFFHFWCQKVVLNKSQKDLAGHMRNFFSGVALLLVNLDGGVSGVQAWLMAKGL